MTIERRLAVATDGTRLSVAVHPGDWSQTPFLLVHGLASNARLWDQVGRGLSVAGYPSYAPDLRGHGESERPGTGYDFATVSDDLFAVLRDVVERGAILVGQSWGGNVVVEAAARHPELVRAVVCVDGGFLRIRDRYPEWEATWSALQPPSFEGLTVADLDRRMRAHLPGWTDAGIEAQLGNFEVVDGFVRARLARADHKAILRAMWEQDPDPVAASLDVPVCVVAMDGSDAARRARVESFAAGLENGTVVWMDGHHDVHAEQPEAIVDLLVDLALELDP